MPELIVGLLSRLFGGEFSDSDAYIELRDAGMEHLRALTAGHQGAWHFGDEDQWDFNQDNGDLVFTFANGTIATCPAQILSTFNLDDNTWLWAWANPSIGDALINDSLKVKAHGEQHDFAKLSTEKWSGSEDDAWGVAAIASKLCDSQGAYRGPAGSTLVFFTFGEVKLHRDGT
jgi:hypothetical protein